MYLDLDTLGVFVERVSCGSAFWFGQVTQVCGFLKLVELWESVLSSCDSGRVCVGGGGAGLGSGVLGMHRGLCRWGHCRVSEMGGGGSSVYWCRIQGLYNLGRFNSFGWGRGWGASW